jgi:hypothetical protein
MSGAGGFQLESPLFRPADAGGPGRGAKTQQALRLPSLLNSAVAELRAKHSVLFAQVFDCIFLPLIHPSSDGHEKKSERV